MGAKLTALFDSGSNGDTITPANSGVTSVGGNTATLATVAAWHGGLGGLFKTVAGGNVAGCFATLNYDTPDPQQTTSVVLMMPLAKPSGDFIIGAWRNASNGSIIRLFIRDSDGGLYLVDVAGGTYALLAAAGDFFYNTKYRLTMDAAVGTSSTNGAFTAKLRRQAHQTQVGSTVTRTNANLGTVPFTYFAVGILGNSLGYQVGVDDVQIQSGTRAELADWAPPANVPPVADAAPDATITSGTAFSRTGNASDSDGTVVTRQWTCPTPPSGVTAPTFPAGATLSGTFSAPGTYTLRYTATDDDGATDTDDFVLTVVSAAHPVASVNQTIGSGIIDARASTAASGGALSYSISPAGPVQITPGVWYAAPTGSDQTFTVTVTEAGSGQSATATATVAASTAGAGFTGDILDLDLPTPLDPATKDAWAARLNPELLKVVAKLNDIQAYLGA